MKTIIVTGTPCTGKTTVAKAICKKLSYKYIDVNKIIKKYNLNKGYDKKRKCYVVDEKRLVKILIKEIKELKKLKLASIVIDSHLSHFLPKKYVDLCIVTKCLLKILQKRLKARGYSKNKIRENLDCEIFDVCYNEAIEMGHKVVVVDTSRKVKFTDYLFLGLR